MSIRQWLKTAVVAGLLVCSGCCWRERYCQEHYGPQCGCAPPQCCVPCQPACCQSPGGVQPVPQYGVQPQWQQKYSGPPNCP
jgi:hypothetical protein